MSGEAGLIDINVLGIMSGTSLDGLDLALCKFKKEATWQFRIVKALTVKYDQKLREQLWSAMELSGEELIKLDLNLGRYIATQINNEFDGEFIIASHGHTVFHQPDSGYTLQIGNPSAIAALCDRPVIGDFRQSDVQLGGQGAPLVPIGDDLLFGDYDSCLNIGGIANVSFNSDEKRIAFDICPANMVLNYLAQKLGKQYDHGGDFARSGEVKDELISELEDLDYYKQSTPKSLGKEWFNEHFLPVIQNKGDSYQDILATCTEHVAKMVGASLPSGRCLVTGGGAHNSYLVERIAHFTEADIHVPDIQLVDFKEALVFAFMGHLRWISQINVLSSVTGASRDHCSGGVFLP